MSTAQTILNQLGHNRFVAMTGAAHLCNLGNGLQFRFKGSKLANSCKIVLNGKDLYDVEFYKVRGLNCEKVAFQLDTYGDDLRALFTRITGLATSL